jgi:hypothetical protein
MDAAGWNRGFQTFDAGFLTPKVVEKPLIYMTPPNGKMHFAMPISWPTRCIST